MGALAYILGDYAPNLGNSASFLGGGRSTVLYYYIHYVFVACSALQPVLGMQGHAEFSTSVVVSIESHIWVKPVRVSTMVTIYWLEGTKKIFLMSTGTIVWLS